MFVPLLYRDRCVRSPMARTRTEAAGRALGASRALLCALPAGALLAALTLLAPGCKEDVSNVESGSTSSLPPSLDARGGEVDSEIATGGRAPFEGDGGDGGSITVQADAGSVAVNPAVPPAVPALDPAVSFVPDGLEIDVYPAQSVSISGSRSGISYLRVQRGGTLVITAGTTLQVTGDVEIAGMIVTQRSAYSIDGKDLTLSAQGRIHIIGGIDLTGWWDDDRSVAEEFTEYPGGNGGNLFISSSFGGGVPDNPAVYIATPGRVISDGGRSFAQFGGGAHPGKGGQVRVSSSSSIVVAGRVSARGGQAVYAFSGGEGDGGLIELLATGGNVTLDNMIEINASGGASSGNQAGAGGSVAFNAAAGTVNLQSVSVVNAGGPGTYWETSKGGDGGQVTVTAQTATMDGVTLDASGGAAWMVDHGHLDVWFTGGTGGTGGTIILTGSNRLDMGQASPVELDASGGGTELSGVLGGEGGFIQVLNQSGNTANLTFDGTASVAGGVGSSQLPGVTGAICTTGASPEVAQRISGPGVAPVDCSGP